MCVILITDGGEGARVSTAAGTAILSNGRRLTLRSDGCPTYTAADFRGLRKLRDAAGKRFAAGVVLYDGETSASFGDELHAVPIRALWEET
jgi:hypothetical protein